MARKFIMLSIIGSWFVIVCVCNNINNKRKSQINVRLKGKYKHRMKRYKKISCKKQEETWHSIYGKQANHKTEWFVKTLNWLS